MDARDEAGTCRRTGVRRGRALVLILLGLSLGLLVAVAAGLARPGGRALAGDGGIVALGAHMSGIPLEINHQGVVMVKNRLFDGTGAFRFALVDPASGDNLWTNDGTNVPGPGMPASAVSIEVDKGVYSVRLGDDALPNMTPIPIAVFQFHDNAVLRIWFDDLAGNGVQQLAPDHVLTSAPYAYHAAHAAVADSVPGAGIPQGVIVMWSGSIANIPAGWALCDGNNGTPNLSSKFIRGVANSSTDPGATGGSPTHSHGPGSYSGGNHTHKYSGNTDTFNWNMRREGDQWDSGMTGTHAHSYGGTTDAGGDGPIGGVSAEAGGLPPYYELAFIIKL